jgi:hypothetical protein
MSILTKNEREKIKDDYETWIADLIFNAIESAVIKKLAREPFGYFCSTVDGWEDCAATDEGARPLYELPKGKTTP